MDHVLMLGSAPMAVEARDWPRAPFDAVVAINNAYMVRPDWTHHIYPWDFPEDRRPQPGPGQRAVTQEDFVPAQNAFGGFVYAGGTMAFTAAYWALAALKPGASLINFARGAIVDDAALRAALDRGHLAHAVLDVFTHEPLPEEAWHWGHPGVTVLPHISAPTDRASAAALVAGRIRRFRATGEVPPAVDRAAGY